MIMSTYKLFRYTIGKSNMYLIVNGCQSVLVDTGASSNVNRILGKLKKHNLNPEDISLIILTHVHYDHAKALADLKKVTGASVISGFPENKLLELGSSPLPQGINLFSKTMSAIGQLAGVGKFKPLHADIVVDNTFPLNEYGINGKIIPTPGHTEGSISIIVDNETAIVGDTMFNIGPGSIIPPFANDLTSLYESWEMLYRMRIQTFYPGHGKPIKREQLKSSLPQLRKKVPTHS